MEREINAAQPLRAGKFPGPPRSFLFPCPRYKEIKQLAPSTPGSISGCARGAALTSSELLSNCVPFALVEQIETLIYLFVLQPTPGLHYAFPWGQAPRAGTGDELLLPTLVHSFGLHLGEESRKETLGQHSACASRLFREQNAWSFPLLGCWRLVSHPGLSQDVL